MKLSLMAKCLLRTPFKTLLMFLLLAATSYMLFLNVAEYAVTAREFERVASFYQGVGAVEAEAPQHKSPGLQMHTSDGQYSFAFDIYLYTDDRVSHNPYDENVIDQYTYSGLDRSVIDAIVRLPYVTKVSTRYMTAGVADGLRRVDDRTDYFNHTARFIAEATFQSMTEPGAPIYIPFQGDFRDDGNFYLEESRSDFGYCTAVFTDLKVLAGDVSLLDFAGDGSVHNVPMAAYYTLGTDNPGSFAIGALTNTIDRLTALIHIGQNYNNEIYSLKFLENLIPGERYIIIGRDEPARVIVGRDEQAGEVSLHLSVLSDPTTSGWWHQVYPMRDLPENYLELDEFAPLREMIEITNADMHTFDVVYTDDMSSIMRFSQSNMIITDGRMLTGDDSADKNNYCVMNQLIMEKYGLKVGDKITLGLGDKLFEQNAAIGAVASVRERYADSFSEVEFEIIGAYRHVDSKSAQINTLPQWLYSVNTIFVPASFLPVEIPGGHIVKPGEFSFVIDDPRNISAFLEEAKPIIEGELGLTLFFSDGGWQAIEKQLTQADSLAMVRLIALSLAVVLAFALAIYLFIVRKSKEYAIMRALGTPSRIASRSMYIPLGLIAIVALIAGNVTAQVFSAGIIEAALAAYAEIGIDTDTTIPALVTVICIAFELVVLIVISMFVLNRMSKKPPIVLLQAGTKR
jgi:hypothetical protein